MIEKENEFYDSDFYDFHPYFKEHIVMILYLQSHCIL